MTGRDDAGHPAPSRTGRGAAASSGADVRVTGGPQAPPDVDPAAAADAEARGPAREASIVVPSYGRPDALAACLAALARLEGGPYRTFVIDDGSPQDYAAICAAAGPWVRHVRQENAGPGAARNRGVAEAGTPLILFTDDDCRPRPDWARRLIEAQGAVPMRLVGGAIVNALPRDLYAATAQSILTHAYEAFGGFDGPFAFFTTNNLCCRREDFLALGGFDTAYRFASEDRDLSRRWQDAGGTLAHVPEAVVDHHHHMTARAFARQQWLYGRGARQFHETLARSGGPDVSLNAPGFYAGLLLHPLRRPSLRAASMSLMIGVAHAIQLGGYLTERRASRTRRAGPR